MSGLTLTLEESLKLTTNSLQATVIEALASESKVLSVLPFLEVQGSGLSFTVQTEVPEANFRAVGEVYLPSQTKIDQRVEGLYILGTEAVVGTYQSQVAMSAVDLMAIETGIRARQVAFEFERAFINGNTTDDINSFTGLSGRVTDKQTVKSTGNIANDLDTAVDIISKGGETYVRENTVKVAVMSKTVRRQFVADNRNYITYSNSEFGDKLAKYGELLILDLEDELMGTDVNSIYVMRLGENGVCGLQAGGLLVSPLGHMYRDPKIETRIEWFCGLALFNDQALAKITDIELWKTEI